MFITKNEAAALKVFVASIPKAYVLGKQLTRRNIGVAIEVAQIGYEICELGYELFLAEHVEMTWRWIKELALFVWAVVTSQEAIEFYCAVYSAVEKLLSKVVSAVKVYCASSCKEKAALRMRVHLTVIQVAARCSARSVYWLKDRVVQIQNRVRFEVDVLRRVPSFIWKIS